MSDGVILVHKPQNVTSHDVVADIRKLFSGRKVGHFGTLDPMATGLLLIGVGKATRMFPFFLEEDKFYRGILRFGFATDTYDSEGIPQTPIQSDHPDIDRIRKALVKYRGEIPQVPPPYSAKKISGKPSYRLARNHRRVELEPVQVRVREFEIESYNPPDLEFRVRCSSGTYIRSLAHDLGKDLGCGAHLIRLSRVRIGKYRLENGHTPEELKEKARTSGLSDWIIPMEKLLPGHPRIILNQSGVELARNGNTILQQDILKVEKPDDPLIRENFEKQIFRLFNSEGRLLALARKRTDQAGLHPFLVVNGETDSLPSTRSET